MEKQCTKCLEVKDVGEYRRHAETKDKLTTYCKGCLYVLSRKSAVKNREKINKEAVAYRAEKRIQIRKNAKKWRETHKGKKNADTAKRFAAKMQRIPKWLTKDEKDRMSCYYQLSAMLTRESGYDWHVDHIVPMRGESVSGLHVPWNLRVIPAQDNMNKGNRYGN
tara:strand:- start:1296 stop:1790 length:495 start_codon:yes stop_codon:yes gene_type:complete